jgi:hypothetical protein
MGTVCDSMQEKRQFYNEVARRIVKAVHSLLLGKEMRLSSLKPKKTTASAVFHEKCDDFKKALGQGRLAGISTLTKGADIIATEGEHELKGTIAWARMPPGNRDHAFVDIKDFGSLTCQAKFINHVSHGSTTNACGTVWLNSEDSVSIARSNSTYDILQSFPRNRIRRDPSWIRSMIKENRPYELPVFVNTGVFNSIVEHFVEEDWQKPCLELVDSVSHLLKETFTEVIENELTLTRYLGLRNFFLRRFDQGVDNVIQGARAKVESYADREKIPYTQNDYLSENTFQASFKEVGRSAFR